LRGIETWMRVNFNMASAVVGHTPAVIARAGGRSRSH
jgi:hypothetical protein